MIILDRPRHESLIAEVRSTGARIKLITDGDLSAAISCAVQGTGVHAVMGIGGAPEGVITAAALRCLGGEIQARFRFRNDEERERARASKMLGHADEDRVYRTEDLASGDQLVFAATGRHARRAAPGRPVLRRRRPDALAGDGLPEQAGPLRRHRPHVRPGPAAGRPPLGHRLSRRSSGCQPPPSQVAIGRTASGALRRAAARRGLRRPTRPSRAARGRARGPRAAPGRTGGSAPRRGGRPAAASPWPGRRSGPRAGARPRSARRRTGARRGRPRAAPIARAPAPERPLEVLERDQQGGGAGLGVGPAGTSSADDRVAELGLVDDADGRRGVEPRHADQRRVRQGRRARGPRRRACRPRRRRSPRGRCMPGRVAMAARPPVARLRGHGPGHGPHPRTRAVPGMRGRSCGCLERRVGGARRAPPARVPRGRGRRGRRPPGAARRRAVRGAAPAARRRAAPGRPGRPGRRLDPARDGRRPRGVRARRVVRRAGWRSRTIATRRTSWPSPGRRRSSAGCPTSPRTTRCRAGSRRPPASASATSRRGGGWRWTSTRRSTSCCSRAPAARRACPGPDAADAAVVRDRLRAIRAVAGGPGRGAAGRRPDLGRGPALARAPHAVAHPGPGRGAGAADGRGRGGARAAEPAAAPDACWASCSSATARRRSGATSPRSPTAPCSTPGSCSPTGSGRTNARGRAPRTGSPRTSCWPTGRRPLAARPDGVRPATRRVPILLGGHGLVGPGVRLALRR